VTERFKLIEKAYDQGGKRRESSQFRTFEIGRSQLESDLTSRAFTPCLRHISTKLGLKF